MRKTNFIKTALAAAAAVLAIGAHAQGEIAQNAMTVSDLIRAENAHLMRKPGAEADAAAARAAAATRNRSSDVQVRSIMGTGSDLRTTLLIDGVPYSRVKVGETAGQCIVVRIENRCVKLEPGKKGVPANACPSSCWTGISADPSPPAMPGQMGVMPTAGVAPLPPGMPVPSQQAASR